MYAVPDVDRVMRVADDLGIHLGPDEAVLYHKYLLEHLDALDAFVQARIEEETPPLCSPVRGPGHRPTPAEDPLNAWMWKCDIPGAPEGLLKGKTVSFKDHTAVAGIPTSYGTSAMDGFRPNFDATVVTRALQAGGTTRPAPSAGSVHHCITQTSVGHSPSSRAVAGVRRPGAGPNQCGSW